MIYITEGHILIILYDDIVTMSAQFDAISNAYEGVIYKRVGHNIPRNKLEPNNWLYDMLTLRKYNNITYIIATLSHDTQALAHEKCHARYHNDKQYRQQCNKLYDSLSPNSMKRVHASLKHMGYNETVHIDEFQAYYYTESPRSLALLFGKLQFIN